MQIGAQKLAQDSFREPVTVLLVGFGAKESSRIDASFRKFHWKTVAAQQTDALEPALGGNTFDMTVIDADSVEAAPDLIAQLRTPGGPSCNSIILVVGDGIAESVGQAATQAGADQVIARPSDPGLYVAHFTQASTQRLNARGYGGVDDG